MAKKTKCVITTTIEVKAIDDKYVFDLFDALESEYASGDWDCSPTADGYEITCKELGYVTFYQGCMYTSNGDGYPDDYDYDFEIWEEDVEDFIEKYTSKFCEDVFTDWSVSQDDEPVVEDYYD